MKIGYLDCFSGISGDMLLGALVSAGLPLQFLKGQLETLGLPYFDLLANEVERKGFLATKVDVIIPENQKRRYQYREIIQILDNNLRDLRIKKAAKQIFTLLARSEAKVHGRDIEQIHFHEIGDMDSLIDVVGVLIGIDYLDLKEIHSSPLNLGNGFVDTEHGRLPIPAPAVLEILQGHPVYSTNSQCELTTPTGAAITVSVAADFIPLPPMKIERIGLGAGSRDLVEWPNILRFIIGETLGQDAFKEPVTVIESNIDDMNPEFFPHLLEKTLTAGALDAFITPIIMKKGRPAYKFTILAPEPIVDLLAEIVLRESSTFGVRMYQTRRLVLERNTREVKTTYGPVKIKIGTWKGQVVKIMPEYEDCRKLAEESGTALSLIFQEAQKEGYALLSSFKKRKLI